MVRQLSEVYSVMRVSSLSELAPYIGFGQAEQLIVDGVKHGYFNARFDHKHNTVHFGGQVRPLNKPCRAFFWCGLAGRVWGRLLAGG